MIIASSSSSSSHSSLKSREVNRRRLKSRACFGNIDAITNSDLDFFAARRRNTTTTPMTPITQVRSRARKRASLSPSVLTRSKSRDEDEPPYFDRPTAFPKTEKFRRRGSRWRRVRGGRRVVVHEFRRRNGKNVRGRADDSRDHGIVQRFTGHGWDGFSKRLELGGRGYDCSTRHRRRGGGRVRIDREFSVSSVATRRFQCSASDCGEKLREVNDGCGVRREEGNRETVERAIVIVLFFGFPLAWWCYHNCAWFVPTYYASRDAAVASATVPYLRARLLAVPAVGINFAFRGFWNAIQQPQVYMNTLVVMHITNITVSFMLIWGYLHLEYQNWESLVLD